MKNLLGTALVAATMLATVPAQAASFSGTVAVTLHVYIVSSFPAGSTLTCQIDLSGSDVTNTTAPVLATDSRSAVVPISGSPTVCAVNVPYYWANFQSTDNMAISYTLTVLDPGATVTRISSQTVATITIPANYAYTPYYISAAL